VRRTFNRMRRRLILEGAVLMVHTDSPHYLLSLVERSGGLVRPLSFLNYDGAGGRAGRQGDASGCKVAAWQEA
jgi:hypothetical protein